MEIVNPTWLDYGQIGLLAIVIIGVAFLFRELFRNSHDRDVRAQAFMEEMIKRASEQQAQHMQQNSEMAKQHTEAWTEAQKQVAAAIQETALTQRDVAGAISNVNEAIAKTSTQIEKHNDLIVQRLKEIESAGGVK